MAEQQDISQVLVIVEYSLEAKDYVSQQIVQVEYTRVPEQVSAVFAEAEWLGPPEQITQAIVEVEWTISNPPIEFRRARAPKVIGVYSDREWET